MGKETDRLVATPAERRRRNREEMEQAILAAACQVMREDGVAGLNLNRVAALVGLRTPSLYEYFNGKPELYDALFRHGLRVWDAYTTISGTGPVYAAYEAFLEKALRFVEDYPELFQLVFERPVPGFVPSGESMNASLQSLHAADTVIEEAIQRGEITCGLSETAVRDLTIAMMHGLAALHLANDRGADGPGRYGGLATAAAGIFRAAWGTPPAQEER